MEIECLICYNEITNNDFVILECCNNYTHLSCLNNWISFNINNITDISSCFYCKQPNIIINDITNNYTNNYTLPQHTIDLSHNIVILYNHPRPRCLLFFYIQDDTYCL